MNRRALFGFLGVSPVAVAGAALAAVDSHAAPRGDDFGITIIPQKPPRPKPPGSLIVSYGGERDPSRELQMKIGEDGHLWIKRAASPRWERVVTS